MSALRLAAASNVRAFQTLFNALSATDGKWANSVDLEALEDEAGRFRVWSGNLGALQKGHSSLDYRLRDSPLLSSNALKFLGELNENLNEAFAVVSGARLPFEQQLEPEKTEEEDDDDDFFDDDDEDETSGSRSELSMRFNEIVDIVDNLYKLGVRIRAPTIRSSRSLKAASYKPKDAETGIDVLGAYAEHDLQHTKELVSYLRQPHLTGEQNGDDFLVERLSAAITLRRRLFKYWKRHRDKLGASTIHEESTRPIQPTIERPDGHQYNDNAGVHPENPVVMPIVEAPSMKTGKTMLSGTEATHHHQSLDELVDAKSVTSYAVTVRDIHGKGIDLPPPPRTANGEKDFECPFCYIICPARYGGGRAWRAHLLQDLQPYLCTYPECESSEQLFRSRREWVEHESGHRRAWRCPEHPTAVYKTHMGLENHLRSQHMDSFPESQLGAIIEISKTTTVDMRQRCPICYVSAGAEGLDFQNHIANHLERISTFALPNNAADDSDGASSVASRGWSGSTGSQDVDEMSLPRDDIEEQEGRIEKTANAIDEVGSSSLAGEADTGRALLLSAESLQQLPDASQNRLELTADQLESQENLSDPQSDDGLSRNQLADERVDKIPADVQEHAEHIEAFRMPSLRLTTDTQDEENTSNASSVRIAHDVEEEKNSNRLILTVAEIPTLRLLYRSRRLLQRDQSYNPNDSYNRMISFCYHDLTRIKADAIVNSANSAMTISRSPGTLNYAIHKAAGSDLTKEAKLKGKLKAGQVELTRGYNLPSAWVIHASRPPYSGSKGMGQFNNLTECYRNTLKMALDREFRTVAFPCLGTGGSGFPPRVAARISLQAVREYLDAHGDNSFKRIIFCVHTARDEKSYMDFFPVFFPPTHGDLEVARAKVSEYSANRAVLAVQVLETRVQIQKLFEELTDFSLVVPDFDKEILTDLSAIDSKLATIRGFLLGSKELKGSLGDLDLNLICSVMQTVCGSIMEITELAKDTAGSSKHQSLWDDYNAHMKTTHTTYLARFLTICKVFVQCLANTITLDGVELNEDEMSRLRQRLESYKSKQVGQDAKGIRNHLDEVLYTREFQRETSHTRDIVRLHQISSVSRLYQLGELEVKSTLAHPSATFNHAVCLTRNDITKMEVDIIVNSTDVSFAGMGTLDRSVFKQGGFELREEVKKFGTCEVGDVRVTPGYRLPVKHILHIIPPQQFRKNDKDILRNIYREVLHTAVLMRATSIAIPSIGTGMLNYPRRDSAALAMEEVKRFLEAAEPTSLVEKIIFVVYSSNDEFTYKNVLPVYFPPGGYGTQTLPATQPIELTEDSSSPGSSPTPRRTLFGSIGEAFRNVRFGKQPSISRRVNSYEEHALIGFESHAKDCAICKDVSRLYLEGRDLCDSGYPLAKTLLWYMNMLADQNVYTRPDNTGQCVRLEVPTGLFPLSLSLLSTVEKSFRDESRSGPFVSQSRPAVVQDRAQGSTHEAEVTKALSGSEYPKNSVLAEHERAADPGSATGPEAFGLQSRESHEPKNSYPEWNQRLHDIRDELSSKEKRERGSSPLQGKMQNPNEAAVRLLSISREQEHPSSQPAEEKARVSFFPSVSSHDRSSRIQHTSGDRVSSLLAAQILVHLTADLKSRPGSYIGQNTQDIASALQKDQAEVSAAIEELASQQKVHNTVDASTWVISHTPKDLPALSQFREKPETRDVPVSGEKESASSLLVARILSYMRYVNNAPGNKGGETIREIASALQLPTAEIWPAIRHLDQRGDIRRTSDAERWVVSARQEGNLPKTVKSSEDLGKTSEAIGLSTPTAHVRDVSTFKDTPPSPIEPSLPTLSRFLTTGGPTLDSNLDLTTINIDDFVSHPSPFGARWTSIDKRLVDVQVLTEAEEEFDELEDRLVVRRVLRRGEIRRWAEKTKEIRSRRDETTGVREHRATRASGSGSGRDGREGREGGRDGRGEKDREQAKLDRVLAGDMGEEELRHFADQDNDRRAG